MVGTVLVILLLLEMIAVASWLGACNRTVEYPEPQPCPALAKLPTGELVRVPAEPSCPLPGPRPEPTLAASVEPADVIYAATMTVLDLSRWGDEVELYAGCVAALPEGEP
jgi:hypothetical protein